jgi:hypothetical protein
MNKTTFLPLASLLTLSVLAGWLDYGPAGSSQYAAALGTLYLLAALALVFIWFRADARLRQYHPSRSLQGAIVALTVLALPYYLLKSRGAGAGVIAIALAVLAFIASMTCYALGSALAV